MCLCNQRYYTCTAETLTTTVMPHSTPLTRLQLVAPTHHHTMPCRFNTEILTFPDQKYISPSPAAMEGMRSEIKMMLQGIERYNPENIKTLEHYVELQVREKGYDLEANLALLKLYQFNPTFGNMKVVVQILLKSLTNLPHTDFVLCKCLLSQELLEDAQVRY